MSSPHPFGESSDPERPDDEIQDELGSIDASVFERLDSVERERQRLEGLIDILDEVRGDYTRRRDSLEAEAVPLRVEAAEAKRRLEVLLDRLRRDRDAAVRKREVLALRVQIGELDGDPASAARLEEARERALAAEQAHEVALEKVSGLWPSQPVFTPAEPLPGIAEREEPVRRSHEVPAQEEQPQEVRPREVPSQEVLSQEVPSQEVSSQAVPSQEVSSQAAPSQEAPSQEVPPAGAPSSGASGSAAVAPEPTGMAPPPSRPSPPPSAADWGAEGWASRSWESQGPISDSPPKAAGAADRPEAEQAPATLTSIPPQQGSDPRAAEDWGSLPIEDRPSEPDAEISARRPVLSGSTMAISKAHLLPEMPTTLEAVVCLASADGDDVFYILEPQMTVGRLPAAGNQIVIEDAAISRQHARIEKNESGDFVLTDLGSSNGTFVNEQRITKHVLSLGDAVQFGPAGFVVRLVSDLVKDALEP